jgi:hypothetical protein
VGYVYPVVLLTICAVVTTRWWWKYSRMTPAERDRAASRSPQVGYYDRHPVLYLLMAVASAVTVICLVVLATRR